MSEHEQLVEWEDLPTWIKGAYSTEEQMLTLQSFTWTKSTWTETYYAYGPKGEYVAKWARE